MKMLLFRISPHAVIDASRASVLIMQANQNQ